MTWWCCTADLGEHDPDCENYVPAPSLKKREEREAEDFYLFVQEDRVAGHVVSIQPGETDARWTKEEAIKAMDDISARLRTRSPEKPDPNADCAKCGAAACRGVELLHVCRECLSPDAP